MSDQDCPTPEQMLARVKTEGELQPTDRKRGRLKVFFGYAAGVGKTFAMLQNGQREKAAGVDVHTTCNVQHVESLNDVIAQISGVVVRETVPDEVFNRADELALIDISTEDLLERLQEGKVYIPEQAAKALQSFFRKDNLTALRELALRRAATRVHADVETARLGKATRNVWATRERLLVCVGPGPTSAKVIRAAKRLADSLDADWVAINIDTPETGGLPSEARARLFANLQLAERLGAETAALTGDDVVADTIAYAQQRNVTKIVIGKSEPAAARWLFRRPSVVDRLISDSGDIDVYVIRGVSASLPASSILAKPVFRWQPWWTTLAVTAIQQYPPES